MYNLFKTLNILSYQTTNILIKETHPFRVHLFKFNMLQILAKGNFHTNTADKFSASLFTYLQRPLGWHSTGNHCSQFLCAPLTTIPQNSPQRNSPQEFALETTMAGRFLYGAECK